MSSETKIGSNAIHERCRAIVWSMKSWMYSKVASHSCTSASKGLQKGLLRIACVLEMWSSRTVWISSIPRNNGTPFLGAVRNSSGSQSFFMEAMAFFKPCSLDAAVDNSSKSLTNSLILASSIICKVILLNSAIGFLSIRLNISVQWRSKTDSEPKALRKGNLPLKSSMPCRNSFAIFCMGRMLSLSKVLIILYTSLYQASNNCSICVELKPATGCVSQSISRCWNWMIVSHNW
mmetsp:Transcript_25025/g.71996  ORF Transcript_25025/g.71996 Transcript_25025/m.71996 type:complete len:234 (-) Transcript_25025:1056-1757(-)